MTSADNVVCKHCGEPIIRFRFKEGRQWWHADFRTGKTYRHCTLVDGGKTPKPAGKGEA